VVEKIKKGHVVSNNNGLRRLALASLDLLVGSAVFFPLFYDVKD
jgi:hypothetical protein